MAESRDPRRDPRPGDRIRRGDAVYCVTGVNRGYPGDPVRIFYEIEGDEWAISRWYRLGDWMDNCAEAEIEEVAE